MDKVELSVITIYIAKITSGWIKNGIVMQSMKVFITKKFAVNIALNFSMRALHEI